MESCIIIISTKRVEVMNTFSLATLGYYLKKLIICSAPHRRIRSLQLSDALKLKLRQIKLHKETHL